MKISIEILYHCRCESCEKWWSIADIPVKTQQKMHCPHCGIESIVDEITNGNGEFVTGVCWLKYEKSKAPVVENPFNWRRGLTINGMHDLKEGDEVVFTETGSYVISPSKIDRKDFDLDQSVSQ